MSSPFSIPFAGRGYDPGQSRIPDLLMAKGQAGADAAQQSGAIWGNAVAGLGQQAAGAIEAHQMAKRDAAAVKAIEGWDGSDPNALFGTMLKIYGPQKGPQAAEAVLSFHRMKGAGDEQDFEDLLRMAPFVAGLPDPMLERFGPALKAKVGKVLVKKFGMTPEQVEAMTPQEIREGARSLVPQAQPKTREIRTRNPDGSERIQIVPDTPGQAFESAREAPKPPSYQPVETAQGIRPFNPQAGTLGDVIGQKPAREPQQPVQRYSPRLVMIDGQEVQANYDALTGKYHDVETGAVLKGVKAAPTADMRNRTEGRKLATKSIQAVEALSKRIITKVGPAQRAEAIKRGTEAVFGSDPEFRTYQDARMALAGNLAVAQQGSRPSDADIKAIWLPLVPDAYRDTADSARLKWELIRTMQQGEGTGGGTVGRFKVEVE